MDKDIVALVITFNPDFEILDRLFHSLPPRCHIVVVDNGSDPDTISRLEKVQSDHPGFHLLGLASNLGIAEAQNRGIEVAREKFPGFRFILTLDHDSVPASGMCESMINTVENRMALGEKIAAVGPVLRDPRTGSRLNFHGIRGIFWWKIVPKPGAGPVRVESLNSSGSLIPRASLDSIGSFDSKMFIDHVETEWCFRAVSQGFHIYADQNAEMEHSMGDSMLTVWFLRNWSLPNRSARRHYTIFRNSIYLQRKSYVPPVWKFWNLIKLLSTFVQFGLLTPNSSDHRRWMLRGISDGWRGKLGPYPDQST